MRTIGFRYYARSTKKTTKHEKYAFQWLGRSRLAGNRSVMYVATVSWDDRQLVSSSLCSDSARQAVQMVASATADPDNGICGR